MNSGKNYFQTITRSTKQISRYNNVYTIVEYILYPQVVKLNLIAANFLMQLLKDTTYWIQYVLGYKE